MTRRSGIAPSRLISAAAALAFLASCTPVAVPGQAERATEDATPLASERLAAVIADPRRERDRARDAWRHPQETLEFFGIAPSMTVAEVYPGGGWYGRILVPYVGEEGGYLGIEYSRQTHEALAAAQQLGSVAPLPATFAADFAVTAASWGPPGSNIVGDAAFDQIPSELYGTVDAALFFRALHNLRATGTLEGALAETYALLKPGGVIGVVQHRAPADATDSAASGAKGYLRQADVIAAFEAAGFVFEEASEINANPNDPADWPNGVWTLPPELTLGLLNRDRYLAIGESDRMTLRFRKPTQPLLGG